MRDEKFDIAVSVQMPGGSRRETVDRTSQAVSLLADRWPIEGRGVKYRGAVRLCGEALKRQKTAAVAKPNSYHTSSRPTEKEQVGELRGLGRALFSDFLFSVEIAGTLLLIASIGAIALAPRRAQGTL